MFPKYIDGADFVRQYTAAAGAGEKFVREGVPVRQTRSLIVLSAPESNAIVLVGTAPDVAELKKVLGLIDVESPSGKGESVGALTFNTAMSLSSSAPIRVADSTIDNMQDRRGFFYYRRYPMVTAKTPMLHWAQATTFRAFALLLNRLA
jgi:hypothetical protein